MLFRSCICVTNSLVTLPILSGLFINCCWVPSPASTTQLKGPSLSTRPTISHPERAHHALSSLITSEETFLVAHGRPAAVPRNVTLTWFVWSDMGDGDSRGSSRGACEGGDTWSGGDSSAPRRDSRVTGLEVESSRVLNWELPLVGLVCCVEKQRVFAPSRAAVVQTLPSRVFNRSPQEEAVLIHWSAVSRAAPDSWVESLGPSSSKLIRRQNPEPCTTP